MISLFRAGKLRQFSDSNNSGLSSEQLIHSIRRRQQELVGQSANDLAQLFQDLRGEWPPSLAINPTQKQLIDAAAIVCQASLLALGVQLYDVQILAGLTLARGQIAEMATGEGKTLTAAMPAAIYALYGRGVHLSTSNEYLAERDCQQLRPLYQSLGLTVDCLTAHQNSREKQAAYHCDITYGPGYEFGFDYLRDQVRLRQRSQRRLGETFLNVMRHQESDYADTLQRCLAVSIVDEIDNVLIDDAASPLMLSDQPAGEATDALAHRVANQIAQRLRASIDFELIFTTGAIRLTSTGLGHIWENAMAVPLKCVLRPWQNYVEQAIRARVLFCRDVDYVVQNGKVSIVDSTTGRIFAERTWRDGLHQAIEAKENLPISSEVKGTAQITRQRFFRLYPRLCGMTGTATGSEQEYHEMYGLNVTTIPLRLPSRRLILLPRFFANEASKWAAITDDVSQLHSQRQPVLIGVRSIVKSELMADLLRSRGVAFQLLNGKQDADEAEIIAKAGHGGAVTIATNMAGRGTDIRPNEAGLNAGGLRVIVTEHHNEQRIDRQLIGRSARQGEVGSARMYVSADDDLLCEYGEPLRRRMRVATGHGGELTRSWTADVRRIQASAEREGYLRRRELYQQDGLHESLLTKLTGRSVK